MNNKIAENIALNALEFLSVNDEYFASFISYSGVDVSQIKDIAKSKGFQISILDFVCLDETLLMAFCQNMNINPNHPYQAFQFLSHYA